MTGTRHDRLAIALITLAGVLMSSSAMQPEHGRMILQSAIEVLDRWPGSDRDLAGWVLAAAVSAQDQAEAHEHVPVVPGFAVSLGVCEGLDWSLCPVSPGCFAFPARPGPLAQGQWQLTSLPPPVLA